LPFGHPVALRVEDAEQRLLARDSREYPSLPIDGERGQLFTAIALHDFDEPLLAMRGTAGGIVRCQHRRIADKASREQSHLDHATLSAADRLSSTSNCGSNPKRSNRHGCHLLLAGSRQSAQEDFCSQFRRALSPPTGGVSIEGGRRA
jgi:hypothetical protein